MIRSLWEVFLARFGRNEEGSEGAESRFVPSPLDLSVRVAHGGHDDLVEGELAELRDRARALEEDGPDDRS